MRTAPQGKGLPMSCSTRSIFPDRCQPRACPLVAIYTTLGIQVVNSSWMTAERSLYIDKPVATVSRACQRLVYCRHNILLWLLHGDHTHSEMVFVYPGGYCHTLMIRHKALCVKISDVPGGLDVPAVPNNPVFGAGWSHNYAFVCLATIHGWSVHFAPSLLPHTFRLALNTP